MQMCGASVDSRALSLGFLHWLETGILMEEVTDLYQAGNVLVGATTQQTQRFQAEEGICMTSLYECSSHTGMALKLSRSHVKKYRLRERYLTCP